jgi:hypothetical protein
MNTDQFHQAVAEHLLKNYQPGSSVRLMCEQFAKDELNYSETRAKEFGETVAKGVEVVEDLNNIKGKKRFFLWYFLNYIKDIALVENGDNSSDQSNKPAQS